MLIHNLRWYSVRNLSWRGNDALHGYTLGLCIVSKIVYVFVFPLERSGFIWTAEESTTMMMMWVDGPTRWGHFSLSVQSFFWLSTVLLVINIITINIKIMIIIIEYCYQRLQLFCVYTVCVCLCVVFQNVIFCQYCVAWN